MRSLSQDWTVAKLWGEVQIDARIPQDSELHVLRYALINRAIAAVSDLFYDLMEKFYLTPLVLSSSSTGKYLSGTATYATATRTITATAFSPIGLSSSDIGKEITFRIGTEIYVATIESVSSALICVVTGDILPSSNASIDAILIPASSITHDRFTLEGLRIRRTGSQVKMKFYSSITPYIEACEYEKLITWQSTAQANKSRILWALVGNEVYLRRGYGIDSYGTARFYYPRLPNLVTADTDYIDLVDGAPIEILSLYLTNLALKKMGQAPRPDYEQTMKALVESLYRTFGESVSTEEIPEKVKALK